MAIVGLRSHAGDGAILDAIEILAERLGQRRPLRLIDRFDRLDRDLTRRHEAVLRKRIDGSWRQRL
jgi:hypothetical protein